MPRVLTVQPVSSNYQIFDTATNEPVDTVKYPTLAQALSAMFDVSAAEYDGLDFFEEPSEEDAARNTTQRTAALANISEGDVGQIFDGPELP